MVTVQNFPNTLNHRIKVYVDPNPESATMVGYKGWVRNAENIEKMRAFLATLDREALSDDPKDSYSKAGFDAFTADIARWDAGDHSDGSVGFFHCPYIPKTVHELTPLQITNPVYVVAIKNWSATIYAWVVNNYPDFLGIQETDNYVSFGFNQYDQYLAMRQQFPNDIIEVYSGLLSDHEAEDWR